MWFYEVSNDSDVVMSTRVRFARSLKSYKFPHMLSKKEKEDVIENIKEVIDSKEFTTLNIKDIDEITLYSLVEKHLISKEFAAKKDGAIITNPDSSIVAMINEEDHLRIQAFDAGFNILSCYNKLKDFSVVIEKKIDVAKSDKYGYLTACPTNVGSGMRVSVMLHLPGLTKARLISNILEQVNSLGLSVRGLYGENTSAYGNIYQISNQQTLGLSDSEIIDRVNIVVTTLINEERKARKKIESYELKDEVYRAYGILKNSRLLKEEECLKLLSKVRLGVAMEIVKETTLENIQRLLTDTHSNCLKLIYKENLSEIEESIKRASYVREELK